MVQLLRELCGSCPAYAKDDCWVQELREADWCAARAAASRRLLLGEAAGSLNDPNPICQFCEVAVSYVKVLS